MTRAGGEAEPPVDGGAAPVVPGSVHRVRIESRDGHGRGIARLDRRELRVANALPGEVVAVRIAHVGRHMAVARIVDVPRPSPARVVDACPHGPICPGCGLRSTSASDRLAFKAGRVADALADRGFSTEFVGACVAAPSEDGWRHKAFVTPRHGRAGITLGMYEEHSHRLVPIPGCPAHAPAVESALASVRAALDRIDPRIYDERRHDDTARRGWLRHVMVRASRATGEAVVVLVVVGREGGDAGALAASIRRGARHVSGVVLNLNPERGNAPFGPASEPVLGRDWIEDSSGSSLLRVSAGSFFQVNPAMAERIQDALEARARSAAPGHALDLYGGVGPSAIRLARAGRPVTLVEAPGPSVADAEANVARWATGGVRIVAERVEEAIAGLLATAPPLVVANPPRSGLSEGVRAALVAAPPGVLLYVSCDPSSLARDAAELRTAGMELGSVTPFDLMPQTPHVEALAAFRRRS